MRAAGLGLTVLLDPSSQLPGVFSPRGQGSSWSARSRAAARTNELDAGKRREILKSEEGPVAVGLSGVVCWFPVRGWRSGLASTHPAPPVAGGCHDHVSGTGLLSQMIERGAGAGSCRMGERARGL